MKFRCRTTLLMALTSLALSEAVESFLPRADLAATSLDEIGFPPCDALIAAGLGDRLVLATSEQYEPTVETWFSASARLRPWCFFQPQTTQEVSDGMVALNNAGSGAGDWHIAVRSGGHGLPGTNNIDSGVTIDLSMMNSSVYNSEPNTATIGSGARWGHVFKDLHESADVYVTGGRNELVGVGGLLLGGGNSYFTGLNGFGCDTVTNYEVVLANGTVVNANAQEHSDLWKALKGGGSNFGLVTRFELEAMPARDLAHGERIITANYSDDVVGAVVDFTDASAEHREDHMFALYMHNTNVGEDITIMFTTVNVEGNLNTTAFDNFKKIPSSTESWELKPLEKAAEGSIPDGMTGVESTLTFLNERHNLEFAAKMHAELVDSLSESIGADNFLTMMFFQPLPAYFADIGREKGGNVLGLDRITGNAILWVLAAGIIDGDDAAVAIAQSALIAATHRMEQYTQENDSGADWVYANYADLSQDPLGSYGADNVAFMKEVAERYDPGRFWQERVPGGFKLARVDV